MQIYLKSKYGFGLSIQGRRGIIRFNNSQKTGATYLSFMELTCQKLTDY